MEALEYAKSLVDKNRLLFATCIAWIVLASLMYFSEVGGLRCMDSMWSFPDEAAWIEAWNAANFGYIELYGNGPSSGRCYEYTFKSLGYIAFAGLPALVLIGLAATVRWVRGAPRTT